MAVFGLSPTELTKEAPNISLPAKAPEHWSLSVIDVGCHVVRVRRTDALSRNPAAGRSSVEVRAGTTTPQMGLELPPHTWKARPRCSFRGDASVC